MTAETRSQRSRRCCHLPAEQKPLQPARDNNAYTPELAARLDTDPNLTDGARRCGRVIAAYAYNRARERRTAQLTVTYLMRAMKRSRRTVQRYLRQLERAGYIATEVLLSARARLCVGLAVTLLRPFFPQHHAQSWPGKLRNSGASFPSQNYKTRDINRAEPVDRWAMRCMDGVFNALLKTLPAPPSFI